MRGETVAGSRLSYTSLAPTEMPIPTVANPELRGQSSSEHHSHEAHYIQRRESGHEETLLRRSSFEIAD